MCITMSLQPWREARLLVEWAVLDSNQRPIDYESTALTTELTARLVLAMIPISDYLDISFGPKSFADLHELGAEYA